MRSFLLHAAWLLSPSLPAGASYVAPRAAAGPRAATESDTSRAPISPSSAVFVPPVDDGPPALPASVPQSPVRIDGRFDDAAWQAAAVAGHFRQRVPAEGAPATKPTTVRVLVDHEALYVGARLEDVADSVSAPLGHRDAHGPSDEFFVSLDSRRDRRTAFGFVTLPARR